MNESSVRATDAILLLLLRIAALAIAVTGLMASGGLILMGEGQGITTTDVGIAIAAIVAIELLALVVWLGAPRLARRFVIANVDGTRGSDFAALGFALLGLWFVGTGSSDLVTTPVQSWVSLVLDVPAAFRDVGTAMNVSYFVGEAVRVVFGAALVLRSRALAAWIGRVAP
jgi:hypothetical protein